MEMKATHKLVALGSGMAWLLYVTNSGFVYYKRDKPNRDWYPSTRTIDQYRSNKDFTITKISMFKGNK